MWRQPSARMACNLSKSSYNGISLSENEMYWLFVFKWLAQSGCLKQMAEKANWRPSAS